MNFLGYKYSVDGVETLGLLPTNKDTPYQLGFYNYTDDTLVLQSVHSVDKVQPFERMTKYGELEKDNRGKNLYERRTVKENLVFKLSDYVSFINNYVQNNTESLSIIENAKSKLLERKGV